MIVTGTIIVYPWKQFPGYLQKPFDECNYTDSSPILKTKYLMKNFAFGSRSEDEDDSVECWSNRGCY